MQYAYSIVYFNNYIFFRFIISTTITTSTNAAINNPNIAEGLCNFFFVMQPHSYTHTHTLNKNTKNLIKETNPVAFGFHFAQNSKCK